MKIVGGIYREICVDPISDNLFGSALRATIAISRGCDELTLISMVEQSLKYEIIKIGKKFNFKTELLKRQNEIGFIYDTPLSSPRIYGLFFNGKQMKKTIKVEGGNVLFFGMIEASVEIVADYLVIDPQGSFEKIKTRFWSANHLAIVANKWEVIKLLGLSTEESTDAIAEELRSEFKADVAVIKCGALGATVADGITTYHIDAYKTPRVDPIGSGDIFSGVFAFFWGEMHYGPEIAAINASRATAQWVYRGPSEIIGSDKTVKSPVAEVPVFGKCSKVYLAAPFFTVSERWLVNLCRDALKRLGANVFSPLHNVGIGTTEKVVSKDIEGLNNSNSILALLDGMDPGAIYEVGYGISKGKQVVVYTGDKCSKKLTMVKGGNTHIHDNLASAIYDAVWMGVQD